MKTEKFEQFIACVPVNECPDFPKYVGYSDYEVSTCDFCPREVWLGRRCKVLAEQGVKKICPFCLVKQKGYEQAKKMMANMTKLTDFDNTEGAA